MSTLQTLKEQVIVFGLNHEQKPVAGCFPADQLELAEKAAASLNLKCLVADNKRLAEIAEQLPAGKILAAGRATVPQARNGLYQKLLAALPAPLRPVVACPIKPPRTWGDIAIGHTVLAFDRDEDLGWYEAIVLEQLNDQTFKLRFRDFPEYGIMTCSRNDLALLPIA